MPAPPTPLGNDELLYRKIHPQYMPDKTPPPSRRAFRPTDQDTNGLSLTRASEVSELEVATHPDDPMKRYYVGGITVGTLKELGMSPILDPGDSSHILITNLNTGNRDDTNEVGWQTTLSEKCDLLDPHGLGIAPGE